MSFRKLFAVLIAALFMLGAFGSVFAEVASDVKGTTHEEAADVLGALKIMVGDKDTGAFRPDDNVKRSEFAKIAVHALGLQDVATGANGQSKFKDVALDHWANGYINVASNQGIIIGDPDGSFRPNDSITYAEATTVLVRVLGHEPAAKAKGNYPTGYLVVGSQIGILKNVSSTAGKAVTRGMIAEMTYNSLTVNLMEQTGFGTDVRFEVVEKTLLYNKLDTEQVKGQITATDQARLTGGNGLDDNSVEIAGVVYKTGEANVRNLLGFFVNAYVKEDKNLGEKTVILARIDKGKNTYLDIKADNVASIENGNTKMFKYWLNKDTDSSTQTATIDTNAKLIFNGKPIAWSDALLKPTAGKVVLLDTNNNNYYDIIFVTSYENYVVNDISTISHSISDKYGKPSIVLDPENRDIKFSLTKAGKPINFEQLKEWDVISVAKSEDGKLISLAVSNDKAEGKVTETDNNKIVIGGKSYEVAANYTSSIALQDEGVFYLDIEGKIAAVDTTGSLSENYAYLVNGAQTGSISGGVEFKLFTKKGEIKILKAAEKLQINELTGKTPNEALAAFTVNNAFVPQLITYEVNSNNEITKLEKANDNTANQTFVRGIFTLNFVGNDVVYKASTAKLGRFNVDKNTVIFDIPNGKTDPVDFAARDLSMFSDEGKYNVMIFNLTENLTAKAIIVTNSGGNTKAESPIAVVEKITSVKNADGNNADKLYAMQDGKEIALLASDTSVLTKNGGQPLQQGDIIQLKTNIKGEVDGVSLLFDIATKNVQKISTPATDLVTVYGIVDKKFTDSVNVTVNGGSLENYSLKDVKVYDYDSTKSSNQVTIASAADVQKYDASKPKHVFIRIYKEVVKEIVIVG